LHGFGRLATFSQRIDIAHAFHIIDAQTRDDLNAIKDIRNHSAHHPKATTFADASLDKHFKKFGLLRSPVFTNPLGKKQLRLAIALSIFRWLDSGAVSNLTIARFGRLRMAIRSGSPLQIYRVHPKLGTGMN
jgi:hypothetical protein